MADQKTTWTEEKLAAEIEHVFARHLITIGGHRYIAALAVEDIACHLIEIGAIRTEPVFAAPVDDVAKAAVVLYHAAGRLVVYPNDRFSVAEIGRAQEGLRQALVRGGIELAPAAFSQVQSDD